MSERDAFLRKLDENEDDALTRMVYADWLNERGEHEEADRQRKWPAAKEWLVQFCADNQPPNNGVADERYYERFLSYKELLALGREAVETTEGGDTPVFDFRTSDALNANSWDFWKNWSIVTGVAVSPAVENMYFRCAC